MPLSPSWALHLSIGALCNLELLRRGLYRVRVSVRGAAPVSCAAHPARLHSLARAVVVLMTYFRVRVATSTISMTISMTRRTRPMWVLGTARVVLVAPATAPV